jgi:hypothetical protein
MIARSLLVCLVGPLLLFSTSVSQATAISVDGIEGTIAWAEQQESTHATNLEGWCQVWVQTAFNAPTPPGADTAWIYFNTLGRPHEGAQPESVPRGALVFFKPSASNSAGHVGIALGNGQMVSVLSAGSNLGVWNTPITYVGGFAGWSMPPTNWPGRPGFGQVSQNPGQTGSQNPDQTGNQNPGQTDSQNPGQTGNQNPGQTGSQNPGQTGNQNPGQTGSQNPPFYCITGPGGSAGQDCQGSGRNQNPGTNPNPNAGQPQSPPQVPQPDSPAITGVGTYTQGVLVYATVSYSDGDGDAAGLGFRGINGSGWAQETHSFSNPSYGRVSPGRVDYPFNLACGQSNQYQSDVEFWIYDSGGRVSKSVPVHLAC